MTNIDLQILGMGANSVTFVAHAVATRLVAQLTRVDKVLVDCVTEFSIECTKPIIRGVNPYIRYALVLDFPYAQAEAEFEWEKMGESWELPSINRLVFEFVAVSQDGTRNVSFIQSRLGSAIRGALVRSDEKFPQQSTLHKHLQRVNL